MQVLYIPSWFPSSKNPHAGSFIKSLAMDLCGPEIEIIVAAFHQHYTHLKPSSTEIEKIDENLRVHHHFGWTLPKYNKRSQDSWIKKSMTHLEKIVEENRIDFIHAHDYISSFIALELFEKTDIPFIVTMHHSDFISGEIPKWRQGILQSVFKNSHACITPSNALAESIEKDYSRTDVSVFPNYIEHVNIPSKETLNDSPNKLIAVSSSESMKNNKELLKFAEENEIHIDVFGNLEKTLRPTEYVKLKGSIPRNELLKKYKDYDGLISMSSIETFGLSIIEGLAAGLPVLINNAFGSSDFVNDQNGILINEDYTSSWKRFISNYQSYSSTQISKDIISKFDKSNIIKQYIKLYRKIYSNLCVV